MNFKELMTRSKNGDRKATAELFDLYKPLLIKESIVNGFFDEDLYQELCLTLLNCIRIFKT